MVKDEKKRLDNVLMLDMARKEEEEKERANRRPETSFSMLKSFRQEASKGTI